MSKLLILNPHAGAIDIGSSMLYCNSYKDEEVQEYAYTEEGLLEVASYFKLAKVTTVALEATGVYWLRVYEVLESAGIEVYMVNGAHVKQLPGRKSDIADALWLRTLHQYGLLKAGFVPNASIRSLRSYIRIRDTHIADGAREVQRMQKALDLMGLKIHQVISQIHGTSGLAIIEAILAGERSLDVLIKLTDKRIQEQKGEDLRKALKGAYSKEHLFLLSQSLKAWKFHQEQIKACDTQIEQQLIEMNEGAEAVEITDKAKRIRHHRPNIDNLHQLLLTLTGGKNPTQIEGINDQSLLKLIAHTGLDMDIWPSEKHFASYASLAPAHDQSGKRKKRRYRKGNKEIKQIFVLIARSVAKMKTELGEFYRQLKARRGPAIALKALARKIAIRYYRIMKYGSEYTIRGIEDFQHNFKEQKAKYLIRQLKKLKPELEIVNA